MLNVTFGIAFDSKIHWFAGKEDTKNPASGWRRDLFSNRRRVSCVLFHEYFHAVDEIDSCRHTYGDGGAFRHVGGLDERTSEGGDGDIHVGRRSDGDLPVVDENVETAVDSEYYFLTSAMGVTTASLPFAYIIDPEYSFYLKREVLTLRNG